MINFKKPKKDQLPQPKKTVENPVYCYSVSAKNSKNVTSEKIEELKDILPTSAYFTSVIETCTEEDITDDTATADEYENLFPEPLTSLFDYAAINLDDKLLEKLCTEKYEEYKNSYTDLAEVTKTQIFMKSCTFNTGTMRHLCLIN